MKALPFLILAWPLIEIAGFIVVGKTIGVVATLLAVVATSMLGVALMRMQGVSVLMDAGRVVRAGGRPETTFAHAALIALGGFLLMVPGFVSDIAGLLLFIPFVRTLVIRWLAGALGPHVVMRSRMEVVDLAPGEWHESGGGTTRPGLPPRRPDGPAG